MDKLNIRFGTSGWRAVIAEEFTFSNVEKVSRAIARYIINHNLGEKGLIVGYDTRFLSKEFARVAANTITDYGIDVFLSNRDVPTPVIAYHILQKRAAGAINITASHNPPKYNGIKFSPAYGGPALPEVTDEIEKSISQNHMAKASKKGTLSEFDPKEAYLEGIKKSIDFSQIKGANLKVGVDLLHGTGRGYLEVLLRDAGCEVEVLHDSLNPSFGGLAPEPAEEQLQELIELVKKKKLHLGLAVDGDGDRFGIVDSDGTYIDANQVVSLLTEHMMLTRPQKSTVARTFATTHMVDALAERRGVKTVETPVGFKFIGQELAKGDCLIGGEESGGLSISSHVPEKDGILACLLIAEMVAARGKSLGEILDELFAQVGPFYTSRIDFRINKKTKKAVVEAIDKFSNKDKIFSKKVRQFNGTDGHKFIFEDGSWLMFRVSGTEPVIRCYLEAKSKDELKLLQDLGHRMIAKSQKRG